MPSTIKKCLAMLTAIFILLGIFSGCAFGDNSNTENPLLRKNEQAFRLLASDENRDLEQSLQKFAKGKNLELEVVYYGTIDMMQVLNSSSENFDAVWPSNSIWLYMLEGDVRSKIVESKFTSINPVIFGVDLKTAKSLGFYGRDDVEMTEIIDAVKSGELSFIMPSATQTNSGASAYLGFLNALAGNPQVLTEANLNDPKVQEEMTALFSGVSRASGSEEYGMEVYLSGDYQGLVGYESTIIHLNQALEKEGRDPVYAVYPTDGLSISDSPFAYVNNGNDEKKEEFSMFQQYLLSNDMQDFLTQTGRRGGYGGLVPYEDPSIFNPDWGINTSNYLAPIKYPSSAVIVSALNTYQVSFRKPSVTVFCLDFSGSMYGEGAQQLKSAMGMILDDEEASKRMIQFSPKDVILVYLFDDTVLDIFDNYSYAKYSNMEILSEIQNTRTGGGTDIYTPINAALERIDEEFDPKEYNISIVMMTDGQSQENSQTKQLYRFYEDGGGTIPVFSITFGDADPKQLNKLADATGGLVFDGKSDLTRAFQTVRAYN